jgi:hypothetical protein
VQAVRRPGRTPAGAVRRWALVDTRDGGESLRWGTFDRPDELVQLPLDGSAGRPDPDPIYLVCAHSKHDTCCALRGRPVAAALEAARPGRVFECSHVGGDRFAANLVLLPHGLYYGHVPAAEAAALVRAYGHGRLSMRWLRGRSSLSAPVQAAQHYARTASGERAVDSYPPLTCAASGPDEWIVELAGHVEPRPLTVVVKARTQTIDEPLTCSSTAPGRVQVFDLVDLR